MSAAAEENRPSNPQEGNLTVIGYCDANRDNLIRALLNQQFESLRRLRGEYTIVFEQGENCTIITSEIGAMHYFYTTAATGPRRFHHGRRLADLLGGAQLDWRWNWQALGDLCQLENLTGNATLHPDVHRVPPGTVLTWRAGTLQLESRALVEGFRPQLPDPDRAVAALNAEVARLAGMPASLVRQARSALEALESQQKSGQAQIDLFAAPAPLAAREPSPVERALAQIDPDALTPKQALETLYRLQALQHPPESDNAP